MKKEIKTNWETMLEYALPDKLTEKEKQVIRENVEVILLSYTKAVLNQILKEIEIIFNEKKSKLRT